MAEPKKIVREYQDDDGKITTVVTWQVRWRDPNSKQRKATFDKRAEAVKHLATMESDKARGQYVNTKDTTTVAEATWAYLEHRTTRDSTRRRKESLVRCHIEAVPLGSRRRVNVKPSEVNAWAADRAKVLAPGSMRMLIGLLKAVFADAVLDHLIAVNPASRVRVPATHKGRIVPLSVAQVIALADAMVARCLAMVLVQAGLGLRIGELLGLRVADVDFLRRTVRVEHQSDERTRELVPPKTNSSRRVIPLPQWVANVLAEHLAAFPAGADIDCNCALKDKRCSRTHSGLIFHPATSSRPFNQNVYGRTFAASVEVANIAIRKANIKLAADDPARVTEIPVDTTSHDLRHHFASVLLAAGESVIAVAEWLGHDNATLVLTTYGHLMSNSEDRMRKAIDAAYGVASDSCAPGAPARSSIKH